jgi:[calcium/calmodulin-dependent protein kinase] kinase
MKAVKRFKRLLVRKRPETMEGIFGRASRIVTPPHSMRSPVGQDKRRTRSAESSDRKPIERALTVEGVHHEIPVSDDLTVSPVGIDAAYPNRGSLQTDFQSPDYPKTPPKKNNATPGLRKEESEGRKAQEKETATHHPPTKRTATRDFSQDDHGKGHAHDPLTDTLFLDIGTGASSPEPGITDTIHTVSESPSAVEMNVYETAYKEEMQRILERRGKDASLYPTRRVDHLQDIRDHENVVDHSKSGICGGGLAGMVAKAKAAANKDSEEQGSNEKDGKNDKTLQDKPKPSGKGLADLVAKAKAVSNEDSDAGHS